MGVGIEWDWDRAGVVVRTKMGMEAGMVGDKDTGIKRGTWSGMEIGGETGWG